MITWFCKMIFSFTFYIGIPKWSEWAYVVRVLNRSKVKNFPQIYLFSNNKRPPFDPVYECLVCQICCQILMLPNTLPSRPTYLLFSALCPSLRLFSDSVDWDFVESYIFLGAPLTLRNLDDIISILCIDAVGRYRRRNQFLGQSEGTKLCREKALFLNIYLN